MADFSTGAELVLEVDDRSLSRAKSHIESELGNVAVDVNAELDGGGGSSTASMGRIERRRYKWDRARTEDIADILDVLLNVDDQIGTGGGGGGGGIISESFGALLETGGDAAIEMGDTIADLAGGAISTAVGNSIANAITGNSLSVKKPNWAPIDVDDPSPLTVSEQEPLKVKDPSPLGVKDPSPLGVKDPSPLNVSDPSPLSVDDPSPLSVDVPDAIPVNAPDSIPVEGGGGGGGVSVSVGYQSGSGQETVERQKPGGRMFRGALRQIPLIGDPIADFDLRTAPDPTYETTRPTGGGPEEITTTVNNNQVRAPISVDAEVNYSELDDLERDIMNEVNGQIDDAIRQLEQKIDRALRNR